MARIALLGKRIKFVPDPWGNRHFFWLFAIPGGSFCYVDRPLFVFATNDKAKQLIVGDVVPCRLAHALVPLA